MKMQLLWASTFFFVLAGCRQSAANSQITQTPSIVPTNTVLLISPTAPPVSTATPMLMATPTPKPTDTSYFPPEAKMQFDCLTVLPERAEEMQSDGVVVLENGRKGYLLGMSTGTRTPINQDGEGGIDYAVSPDRIWLAYDRFLIESDNRVSHDELVVANASGEVETSLPWEEGWGRILDWLNDDWLVLNLYGLDPLADAGYHPNYLLALNPFSGERKLLAPDYPNIHTLDKFDWEGWSRTMYDPTLTRVVYLTEYDDFSYVLWDLENDREITRLPARIPMWNYIPIPRWSPDGSRFIVEAWIPEEERLELFQVSRDGEIEQLTNLYPYGEATLAQYSWSPDGRYLAGLLDTGLGQNPELELVVLDTQTRQITNTCLKVTYFYHAPKIEDSWSDDPPLPIWSPDGTQLLVANRVGKEGTWQVILVDLKEEIAVVIAENMEPVGWMVAPEK